MNENFRSIELRDLKSDELYHHGVLGMSWGKRNGPPYPLGGADKKFARAEAKRKKQREKQIAKMQKGLKKARKAKARADKKERRRLEQEMLRLQKKEMLLKRDNYKEIMRNSHLFTSEELKAIKARHDQEVIDRMTNFLTKTNLAVSTVNSIANATNAIKTVQAMNQKIKMDNVEFDKRKLELDELRKAADRNDAYQKIKDELDQLNLDSKRVDYNRNVEDLWQKQSSNALSNLSNDLENKLKTSKLNIMTTAAGNAIRTMNNDLKPGQKEMKMDDIIKLLNTNVGKGGGGGKK